MKNKKRVGGSQPVIRVSPKVGGGVGKDEWKFSLTIGAPIKGINNYVGSTFIISRVDTKILNDDVTYQHDIHIMPLPDSNPWSNVYKSVMRVTDEINFRNRVNKMAFKKKPKKVKRKSR